MNMRITIDGVPLPVPNNFQRNETPNETTHRTLGGSYYTDFLNINRTWELTYDRIKAADFDIIQNIYLNQYKNKGYPIFYFQAYGISTPVKVEINSHNVRYNGNIIEGLRVKLIEQYAIS